MTEWILTSSVLILAVTLLRTLLKGHIGLRLQYALWLLVLVRLLLPFQLFDSRWSILNGVEHLKQPMAQEADTQQSNASAQHMQNAASYTRQEYHTEVILPQPPDIETELILYPGARQQEKSAMPLQADEAVRWVWLGGIVLMLLWLIAVNTRFAQQLRQNRKRLPTNDYAIPIYCTEQVATPCLFGLFRPVVYVTAEAAANETTLRHVLAHELSHYRHGDHIWSCLRSVCLALHWYNPLVWMATHLSRRDAELACDEGAICRMGEDQRIPYGRTLIDMTCRDRGTFLLAATTMMESRKSLRERIKLIAKHPKTAVYTLTAVICAVVLLAICTMTGAKQDIASSSFPANRAEIAMFGSSMVCEDLTGDQLKMLIEMYDRQSITKTSQPVGDAARLEMTFYNGDDSLRSGLQPRNYAAASITETIFGKIVNLTSCGSFIGKPRQSTAETFKSRSLVPGRQK